MSRQPPFVITSYPDDEPALGEISKQASELMPGEIRQPKVQPPTPLLDWGRGESLMWDPHFGGNHGEDHGHGQSQGIDNGRVISPSPAGRALDEPSHSTPLTGYGRGDNIWGVSPTAADVGGFPGGRSNSDYGGFGVSSGPPTGSAGSLYQGNQQSRGSAQHHPQPHQGQSSWSAGPIGSRPANTGSFTNHQQTYSHSADYGYPGQVRGSPTNPPGPWNQHSQRGGGGQGPIGSAVGGNSYQVRSGGDPFGGMSAQDRGSFYRDDTGAFPVRSHSQVIADELYHQSLWFPPPPPPRVPKESRRSRAELWYYYASKWDITHMQPPPPRNPLSLMEEEHAEGLPHCTKVPYRGEYWLNRCEYWFNHVQATFRNRQITAESNSPYFLDASFIMNRCVTE